MGVPEVLAALVIIFLAAFIKSVLGFGESLLSIPVLSLVLGVQIAIPLISIIVFLITIMLIARNWRSIDFHAIRRLTIGAIIGVPVGALGLKVLPEKPVMVGLGIVLILVGFYYLIRPQIQPIGGKNSATVFGFMSGVLGGAYNMSGAPIIVYGAMQQWEPQDFRGTLQSYFFVVSLTILTSHALAGLWSGQILLLLIMALPGIGVGFWVGTRFGDYLPRDRFEQALYIVLVVLGVFWII